MKRRSLHQFPIIIILLKLLIFVEMIESVEISSTAAIFCSHPICSKISEDFCFYFGKSSCYQLMCLCSDDCKNVEKPFWCVNGNEEDELTIDNLEKQLPIISMNCDDLHKNCKQRNPQRSGHCFFYDKTCLNETWTGNSTLTDMDHRYPDLLSTTIKKRGKNRNRRRQYCVKLRKRCEQHDENHLSCRRFENRCRKFEKVKKPTSAIGYFSLTSVFLLNFFVLIL